MAMILLAIVVLSAGLAQTSGLGWDRKRSPVSDETVRSFLESRRGQWRDMNVPESDARALYDLILKHQYTRALEIGTSTGHSGIWIAWALSKTGGKLITIEIDEDRYREALDNFKKAGLSEYVDARLADAHDLVPRLPGRFDFIFCDADKDWYANYLKAAWPKIEPGGCFTAHNVLNGMSGIREFLDSARGLKDGETTIERTSGSGISMTFKRPAR